MVIRLCSSCSPSAASKPLPRLPRCRWIEDPRRFSIVSHRRSCAKQKPLFGAFLARAVDKVVAQVSNRFPTCCIAVLPACGCPDRPGAAVMATFCRLEIGDTAGWKPALRRTGRTLSLALRTQVGQAGLNVSKFSVGDAP